MHTKALHSRQASPKLDTVGHGIRTVEEVPEWNVEIIV